MTALAIDAPTIILPRKFPAIFLETNPIFDENDALWKLNERRMRGGPDVLCELRPFDWETLPDSEMGFPRADELDKDDVRRKLITSSANSKPGDHYRFRQLMATYLNFPEMFATAMLGILETRAPKPGGDLNFGQMGDVDRAYDRNNPTDAELVYFNADGIGNDGSQWDNYWSGAMRRAMATGHRWVYVDAPARRAANRQRLVDGRLRPYITDFSPRSAPQFVFEHGQLAQITLLIQSRRVMIDGEVLKGNRGTEDYLIMTRRGFQGFGSQFAKGGWWLVDPDGEIINEGNWNRTKGEIPVCPLYYQREYSTRERCSMSRPAITELGNAAISYMNISSASDFDAWDAAASIQFLRGVNNSGYEIAMKKLQEGSRYVPLPANDDGDARASIPIAQDSSMGAVTATVFDMALKRKLDEVSRLAATQAVSAPDSSGLSKAAGFGEAKVPRLALLASELEAAQNSAIRFLELRFGHPDPHGQVVWTRKFDLVQLSDSIEQYFNLEVLAGMRSKTVGTRALLLAARDKGLITDEAERTKIEKEYGESLQVAAPIRTKSTAPTTPSGQGLSGAQPAADAIIQDGLTQGGQGGA